ncbi:Methyltransferase [Roseomonas mucosa]|uniref:Glycine/sarcosine N-methyltransferase n=1 Tax=Roseomonas mucosa TaxID=207340 RepID=A0A379MXK1_9PROT|nr:MULTISPECIES: class I SAM-dependent methyltransferase [Roseomonas]MBS5904863.1 class I SAM-dependent methyltransferase [Acetobacteraceae bacterium]MCG7351473.1 class I SAM-dependent methyltransferase [Roseomonas mucosa]MCG7357572.1 class I SAM-dependent methyltransferase [Roseomonas mucosa]MDT8291268.1 class I SAM-dependent methyltransferase [Roseomonas mucosa]MDT8293002.1 class I SAM-dependent methyltransferase [Roseomonas mucosa]
MSDAPAWDTRYDAEGFTFGEQPNRYLESMLPRLRPGQSALALGDGEGRNGVWLARQGLNVTSLDWSARGLAKARALAGRHGVALETVAADLTRWNWPQGRFDLVAWIFVHLPPEDRALVAQRAVAALAPGGLLVLEGFSPAQEGRRSGGPRDPALLWTATEARRLFGGMRLLECLDGTVLLDEGPRHQGEAEVVRGLWRQAG